MKYAIFDNNGFPTGFYDDAMHNEIPIKAVSITDDQYAELVNNQGRRKWDGTGVVEYTYQPTDDELAAEIRSKRDALLAETDYLLMPDYPISNDDLAVVKAYRQALRDITSPETFPQSVTWPDKPVI